MMKKHVGLLWPILLTAFVFIGALPAGVEAGEKPWSKYELAAGGFFAANNSSVRFGGGIGLEVSLEDALGLDVNTSAFRLEGQWRFTQNLRHSLYLSWHSIKRSGDKTVSEDFTIENPDDPDGPPIIEHARLVVSNDEAFFVWENLSML